MNTIKNVKSHRPPIISIVLFVVSTIVICICNFYIEDKNAQIPVLGISQALSFVSMILKLEKEKVPNEVNDPFEVSIDNVNNAINPINELPVVDCLNQDTVLASSENVILPI